MGIGRIVIVVIAAAAVIWTLDQANYFGGSGTSGAGQEASEAITAGPLRLYISLPDGSAKVGRNLIRLQVDRADGTPVSGADVRAVAEMPAMGSMPPMRAAADVGETGPGQYQAQLELSMSGEWPLAVDIAYTDEAGQNQHVDLVFDMATGRKGLSLVSATPAGDIAYHTCSMHPSVKSAAPGTCPICGMDLVPVTHAELRSGSVKVEEGRRQAIGVKTGVVVLESFSYPLRLQGQISIDANELVDVSPTYEGWLGEVHANEPGQFVRRGDVLFTAYSPELLALQEAHRQNSKSRARSKDAESLWEASRARLRLAGLNTEQIEKVERKGVQQFLPVVATSDMFVVESQLVKGASFKRGESLLRLAGLSSVWVEAYVYEQDIGLIQAGMPARVEFSDDSQAPIVTTIHQITPFLNQKTRTARLRIELENADRALRPGQFVEVWALKRLGEQLLVPVDAVLVSGEKRFVFKDLGEGHLKPVEVRTGYSDGDRVVIRNGLDEGDRIVTSGVFLIAAESKLKLGLEQW